MGSTVSSLISQSQALGRAGHVGAAFRLVQQALDLAQEEGDPAALADATSHLAYMHFRLGHYQTSQALARDAQQYAAAESVEQVDALLLLGLNAAETDDPDSAEGYYHQAIDLARQQDYDEALIRGLHNLAVGVYIPRGQFDLALAVDEDAYRLAMTRQMPERAWSALAARGWVYWRRGQWPQTQEMAAALEPLAPSGSLARGFHDCLLADLAQEQGEIPRASAHYADARVVADVVGDPGLNVLVRLGMSRLHHYQQQAAAAWNWANEAWVWARRVGYVHLQGMALIARAKAAWLRADRHDAEQDLRQAIDLMEPLHLAYELARAWLLLAALLHEQTSAEAESAWEQALHRIAQEHYYFLLERERALAFPLLAHYLHHADPELRSQSHALLRHLASVPPPPLRIYTLGRFVVWQGGRRIADSAWSKRRAGPLFCLLLLSPRHSLTQEQVITYLWPEKGFAAAQPLLHQATSTLRRCLEPDLPRKFPSRYLSVEEGSVHLHLSPGAWIDFQAFTDQVVQGDYEQALILYEGELLPAHRYADWAIWERERLAQRYLQALLAAAEAALVEGQAQRALLLARKALVQEPWQEQAVHIGMEACILLHDRAGALRLYQTLAQRLATDLGIEPEAELQELYRLIVEGSEE